jgi:YVTN family beta-propeller protein
VKFSDNPTRKKAYITNQGCDIVAVLDIATNVIMRYIPVGNNPNPEVPHTVKISPDGKYWCVCFASGDVFQIFSTSDDKLVATIPLPSGSWNTIAFSSDSKMVYTVDWNSDGHVACIDLENKSLKKIIGGGTLEWSHGIALFNDTVMYVSANKGNFVYRANIEDLDNVDFNTVVAEKNAALNKNSSLDIHEIVFSPDNSKYFLSCQTSNEVRVMDAQKDTLIAVINTGKYPVEFSFSTKHHLLFVSCMEDDTYSSEGIKGSITAIDYTTNTKIATIKSGYQPHGLFAYDAQDILYIINRNISSTGPTPHHTSYCGGRNGYYQFIDMNTLKLIGGSKRELSNDPYSIAIRQ